MTPRESPTTGRRPISSPDQKSQSPMASSSSSSSSSSPQQIIPIAQPLSPNPVTLASSSPHQILTLALPIQPPPPPPPPPLPPSSSRDDCWSDSATSALIHAWSDRYLQLNRGNLRQHHWQDVADAVTSRHHYSKPPKSHAQCKNRIDTLKKKYKAEKSKPAVSSWQFFHRLDLLLAPTLKPPSPSLPKKQRTTLPPTTTHSSTSDSLPPAVNGRRGMPPGGRMRELTRAILRFGEVYQRVESSKLEQSMEMERQRMEFSRELEEQRMRFFIKTQIELSQLSRTRPSSGSEGGGTNHHRRRLGHQPPANRN